MARFPVRDDDRRSLRYRAVSGFWRVTLRAYYGRRLRVEGLDHIPADGPLLLACNHLSALDPILMGAFVPRTLFAMAKVELFRRRWLAWVLRGSNVFPVSRGTADRRALTLAIDIITRRRGRLMIFIEGTRARVPGMTRAEPGVGFLERRSGSPVLPVGIWGSERALARGSWWPRRCAITIRVGEPFTPETPPGGKDDQSIADAIAVRIAALLPVEYRGVYADSVA